MIAYIKRFTDFETVLHSEVTNYELPIEAVAADEKGSIELPMLISPDLVGSWLYIQGRIYLIANIAPQNGRSILTTAMPDEAFGRPIAEGAATQNIGAFILDCLQTNYKNQTDPQYRLSYLEITNADTSAFVPPIIDENGLFVLSDYISAVRAKTKLTYSVDKNKLKIEISKNQPKQHNAVLSKSELKNFTVAKTAIAKVTVLGENETYYLTTSGEASLTVPAERVSGEWVYLKAQKDKTAQETAQAAFDGNINSYKVEFHSKKLYGLHDKIKMNVDNQLLMGDVTFVGRAMKDTRYLVKLGSLPTTAAEKMRTVKVGGGSGESKQAEKYEVGDIFITTREGNPADILGYGTWEQIKGRFLIGTGVPDNNNTTGYWNPWVGSKYNFAVGETGGSPLVTLDKGHLPATPLTMPGMRLNENYRWAAPHQRIPYVYTADNPYPSGVSTNNLGDGAGHSNMTPFYGVHMWRRTA